MPHIGRSWSILASKSGSPLRATRETYFNDNSIKGLKTYVTKQTSSLKHGDALVSPEVTLLDPLRRIESTACCAEEHNYSQVFHL